MSIIEWIFYTLIGLFGIGFAVRFEGIAFSLSDYLPGKLGERKTAFFVGFAILLVGFAAAFFLGNHHGLISLLGGWLMLLGGAPWFRERALRKLFDPVEMRVIRATLLFGLVISLLSTGWLYFPPCFSPGTLLMGISVMIPPLRLWWNQDLSRMNRTMIFSKRDYS